MGNTLGTSSCRLVHVGKDSLMMLGLYRQEWLVDYCVFPIVLQQTTQT